MKPLELKAAEVRSEISQVLKRVAAGQLVVLTHYRKAVAAIIGPSYFERLGLDASTVDASTVDASAADASAADASTPDDSAGEVSGTGATERRGSLDAAAAEDGDPAEVDGSATAPEPTPKELLERASRGVLRRIEADRARLPKRLQPVMALVRDNLFHPGFTVEQIRRVLGVGSNNLTTRFQRVTGTPIRRYMEDRRLECACCLIEDTDLEIGRIAGLLGYRSMKVFSRAFDRRFGVRPSVYRDFDGRLSKSAASGGGGRDVGPRVPRHVVAVMAASAPCERCGRGMDGEERAWVCEDFAPICDFCARVRAPQLAGLLRRG